MAKVSSSNHNWQFRRAGGVDQVVLRNGADIAALEHLDQKLWIALTCPTKGLEFDWETLEMLDTDHNGRVRVRELLEAIRWLKEALKSLDGLLQGTDTVPLSAIDDSTETGQALLASARRVLESLGKEGASSITLADVTDTEAIFRDTTFNGDGVVIEEAAEDEFTRQAIKDIMAGGGQVDDRSGKPGVDANTVAGFFAEAKALDDWHRAGEDEAVQPLGEDTEAAFKAVEAVRSKVDDFFARTRLAAFDERATSLLNRTETELADIASGELTSTDEEIARLPLAHVSANADLPLLEGTNPAWAERLEALYEHAVQPLLGKPGRTRGKKSAPMDSLSESDWHELVATLAPYGAWRAEKPTTRVHELGLERLRELLDSDVAKTLEELIARDAALAPQVAQIGEVEKLVRYHRDLVRLLNNFVNFSEFYGRKGATFQAGTLYLDARSCNLCFRIEDPAKHGLMAALARTYLAYCDCRRPATGEKMTIAAAFTNGDSDHLMVGRNGLFYDRKGRDWDATIVKVIEHPISIREAFWSPYKRFLRMIEEQVAKRAAAKDAEASKSLAAAAEATATADKGTEAKPLPAKKIDVGTVAAIGVAVAGFVTFLSTVLGIFFGLGMWMPIGILALILAISLPSVVIAWLKLRQRNLGPILDASGWAVNARVKVNVPFGKALTDMPSLPKGSKRSLSDPYAEKKRRWWVWVLIAAVLALAIGWYIGKLDRFLPQPVKSTEVLGKYAPAAGSGEPEAE